MTEKRMKKSDPEYGTRDYEKEKEIWEKEKDILLKGQKLSQVIVLKGIGQIKEYGELDVEKLIKKLLEYKSITGDPNGK